MRILIEEGKHSTEYYDVSTNELLAATALKILTERFKQNWYWKPTNPNEQAQHIILLTEEQIEKLPEHLQEPERKKLRSKKFQEAEYLRQLEDYQEIERIVKEKDVSITPIKRKNGKVYLELDIPAWNALEARCDYEYEEVRLEKLINVLEEK